MILNRNDDEYFENPDEQKIRSVLADLPAEEFAILSRFDEVYVQVYHNEDNTYQLEFRNGSYDQHFGADPDLISLQDVQNAFAAFLGGADDWSQAWVWEKIDFDEDFEGSD